jgi:hypothetical protein
MQHKISRQDPLPSGEQNNKRLKEYLPAITKSRIKNIKMGSVPATK